MTYQQVAEKVLELPKFSQRDGFLNAKALANQLDNPQDSFSVIHVAGSNGKGSVCAYTASMLQEAGFKVGLFTSPHLVEVTERIQMNGVPVAKEEFVKVYEKVHSAATGMEEKGMEYPNFGTFLFGMALVYFKEQQVDYAVIETGLGGRIDATNVIASPVVTAITSISLEHTQYLGNTLEEIAREKAGIFKKGVPALVGVNPPSVVEVLEQEAKKKETQILKISERDYEICEKNHKHIDFSLNVKYYGYVRVSLPSVAVYQVENAVLAIRILEQLLEKEQLSPRVIQQGLNRAYWPARMEKISENIYLDGAHNQDGIRAFLQTAKELTTENSCILLFGAVRDKNYRQMIRELMEGLSCRQVVATPLQTPRSLTKSELCEAFEEYTHRNITICENTKEAYQQALKLKEEKEILFCVGSLYLAGEIKMITGD